MAERYFPDDVKDHGCGCSVVAGHVEPSSSVITCLNGCTQKVSVRKLESRRVCVDFGSCQFVPLDCGGCPEYSLSKSPEIHKANPPGCPESEGKLGVNSYVLDPKSGRFYFTVDAFDTCLQNGERYHFTMWMELPNGDVRYIQFYVVIG